MGNQGGKALKWLPAHFNFRKNMATSSGQFVPKSGVRRGTGAFIYVLSANKTLFSCRFKCACRSRWQPHFRSNADRAYNTLHFASKVVCQMGALPPLETPARKGDTLPLCGAHIAFSCYTALRLYLSSKSKRGCSVVSLTMGNFCLPFTNRRCGYSKHIGKLFLCHSAFMTKRCNSCPDF